MDFPGKTTKKTINFLTKQLNNMATVQRTNIPCLIFQMRARPIGIFQIGFVQIVGKTTLASGPKLFH